MTYTRLISITGAEKVCLGTFGIPDETVRAVNLLIGKSRIASTGVNPAMLEIAHEITRKYPSYLCANFATSCLIVAGASRYEKAGESLLRAWTIGVNGIKGRDVHSLKYSASQANASFLTAGAMLAQYSVWQTELAWGLDVVDKVIALDEERATSARFVQAHIHQLMGRKDALVNLKAVAGAREPMAFYALGLEQLRLRNEKDAHISFQRGFRHAPVVAAILLNRNQMNNAPSSVSERDATHYVETYCLSEWTASELGLLQELALQHADSVM